MTTTAEMIKAPKDHCVPVLREMGFKGSFPNFYRDDAGFVCLVNFQFNTIGGAFCINLGFADPARRNVASHRRDVEARKLRVSICNRAIGTACLTEGR